MQFPLVHNYTLVQFIKNKQTNKQQEKKIWRANYIIRDVSGPLVKYLETKNHFKEDVSGS